MLEAFDNQAVANKIPKRRQEPMPPTEKPSQSLLSEIGNDLKHPITWLESVAQDIWGPPRSGVTACSDSDKVCPAGPAVQVPDLTGPTPSGTDKTSNSGAASNGQDDQFIPAGPATQVNP
jgi:hypothetical protein